MSFRRKLAAHAADIPLYRTFRTLRKPILPPIHIALSVTRRCNNRCLTCESWNAEPAGELSINEYALLFKSIQFKPLAMTFTGGEPLIRDDFPGIVALACGALSPAVVFIETSGDMPVRLNTTVRRLAEKFTDTTFCIRLSMPATSERFDAIRGGKDGAFENFLRSFRMIKGIGANNVSVEIRVPVSHYNENQSSEIIDQAFSMYPDLVSVFPAYGSEELGISAAEFMPTSEGFGRALALYLDKSRGAPGRGFNRAMWPMLRKSSSLAGAAIRKMKQPAPCQAAYSFLFINPVGAVLDCPVAAREIGRLPEFQFDLTRIINSQSAAEARRKIDSSQCFCPMEYTSLSTCLLSASTLARII